MCYAIISVHKIVLPFSGLFEGLWTTITSTSELCMSHMHVINIYFGYYYKSVCVSVCVQKDSMDKSVLSKKNICDRICEKRSYSLSNWMCLTIHCVTYKHGTNLKFGHLTLLTWFYFWEKLQFNRLNTEWVVTNQSWNLRKAIRPLFADPVTYCDAAHSS